MPVLACSPVGSHNPGRHSACTLSFCRHVCVTPFFPVPLSLPQSFWNQLPSYLVVPKSVLVSALKGAQAKIVT